MNAEFVGNRTALPRLTELDGLRGMAAIIVAFGFHYRTIFNSSTDSAYSDSILFGWLVDYGWTAVDLFFVLSGYVFAHVYLTGKSLETSGGQYRFVIARLARLYPLHIFMLAIAAIALHRNPENSIVNALGHVFMAQGFIPPVGDSFVGPSWSISVEIFCYVLFALAVFFIRPWMIAFSIFAVTLSGSVLLMTEVDPNPTILTGLARGILGFFVGQLAWHWRTLANEIPSVVLIACFIGGLMLNNGPLGPVAPLSLLAWPCLLILALRIRIFASKPFVWIGDRSYAIYLLHMPLLEILFYLVNFDGVDQFWRLFIVYCSLVAATLFIADILYRRLERPLGHAIRQWGFRARLRSAKT
jgi:peptidoglycan/LPS O-acetylase OafA/YrhL